MLDSLIDGIFGAIGTLVAAGLLILLAAFLCGTTIGRVLLVLLGLSGLFAIFYWIVRRVEKRRRLDRDYYPTD